jgi:hypothetical protein
MLTEREASITALWILMLLQPPHTCSSGQMMHLSFVPLEAALAQQH